jgi:hypothetical protein
MLRASVLDQLGKVVGSSMGAMMTPEREALIRATWADRRRWIDGWDVRKTPRLTVVPTRRPSIIPPDLGSDTCLREDTLTFEHAYVWRSAGRHGPEERWARITCEGVILEQGRA